MRQKSFIVKQAVTFWSLDIRMAKWRSYILSSRLNCRKGGFGYSRAKTYQDLSNEAIKMYPSVHLVLPCPSNSTKRLLG